MALPKLVGSEVFHRQCLIKNFANLKQVKKVVKTDPIFNNWEWEMLQMKPKGQTGRKQFKAELSY